MNNKSMVDDLDYLRTLAEAGERAPLLGGRFYLLWGVLITFAYSAHYAIVTGSMGALNWLGVLWIGVVAIGLAAQFVMIRGLVKSRVPGSGSAGNQTSMHVWQFAGVAMFALFAGLIGKVSLGFGTPIEFDWSIPVVFALYSMAMGTSGAMAKSKTLTNAAYLAALVFAGAILLVGRPELYLLAAMGMVLTAIVPGLVLLRDEPSQTV